MIDETRRAKLQAVIDSLRGSADSIEHTMEGEGLDYDTVTTEEFWFIDGQIFLCETCGWWCDDGEMSETEQVCDECDD